jgi:ABC-type multidrug transport system fused ATPase/permease subunit
MLVASVAEIVSIGAVVPFLGALTSPEAIFSNPSVAPYLDMFGITSNEVLLATLTGVFIAAGIVAGLLRLALLWGTTRLSFSTGADLSYDIYCRTLNQSYEVHISRNSSEVITGITTKANAVIINVIVPLLFVVSSLGLMIAILMALFAIDPLISIVSILGFGMLYSFIAVLSRKRLRENGQHIAEKSNQVVKALQEGLGGIRNILIDGTQEKFGLEYRKADLKLRYSQGDNLFLSQSPRFGMESLGMVLIGVLAYVMSHQPGGLDSTVPILGAMALGAQRSLPLLQRIYLGWASLQGGLASLNDILDLLDQSQTELGSNSDRKIIPFQSNIDFTNLSYRYGDEKSPWIFKGMNFRIRKGSRLGVIGDTGSGKTTFVDLLMGLLEPTEGAMSVDRVKLTKSNMPDWQLHISHVPQGVYLADSSIAENIAFGVAREEIDMDRVIECSKRAQIHDLIETWVEKYEAFVGERGVKLSGGQIQRIGIARALYKRADIIVFDEATSALDSKTEQSVIEAIESLSSDLTIVMIAHRLSTLRNCDQIIRLGAGGILEQGNYVELIGGKE